MLDFLQAFIVAAVFCVILLFCVSLLNYLFNFPLQRLISWISRDREN